MGKKVFVVPPQAVNVNVSVNVQPPVLAVQSASMPDGPPGSTQVNTSVQVGAPSWAHAGQLATVPTGPYVPPFQMPTSDVLRRKIPMLSRQQQLGLGDHVHTASCVEQECALLAARISAKVTARPWAVVGWLLVAVCVWVLQYSLVVPLAWLGAVARSGAGKAIGFVAILICGFGPLYALFYRFSPHVPRGALVPWGLSEEAKFSGTAS